MRNELLSTRHLYEAMLLVESCDRWLFIPRNAPDNFGASKNSMFHAATGPVATIYDTIPALCTDPGRTFFFVVVVVIHSEYT